MIVIIAAEMIGATVGMGYMILEAQQTFRTEHVFAGIFVIGAIGFATDLGFRRVGCERLKVEEPGSGWFSVAQKWRKLREGRHNNGECDVCDRP